MDELDENSRLPTESLYDEPPTPTLGDPETEGGSGDTVFRDAAARPLTDSPESITEVAPAGGRVTELRRGDRLGRHVILERLGAGGMGVVYAAYDPKLDRKIAIKLLHPGRAGGRREQERLLREAQALAKLDDPGVVTVFDIGTAGPWVFVAMEYVPGTSLLKWIAETPRTTEEILAIFDAAGKGLAAAHAAGLVHRDFKSNNVLVRDDGVVKVLDFGLARVADDGAGLVVDTDLLDSGFEDSSPLEVDLTVTGSILGTPAYMAPEQRRGEGIGPAADQFAFCVTLYRALYQQWPFAHARDGRFRPVDRADWQVIPPPETTRVPARLFEIVSRGLGYAPEHRYPSMEALLADLRAEPWYRSRRGRQVGAAVVALALLSGAWIADRQARSRPCRGATERLAEVWDDRRAAAVSSAFLDTGQVYAVDSARQVHAILDDYGGRWSRMHTEACEATHLRREQSEDLLDRRMACLETRRQALGALIDVFVRLPAETVAHSVEAVGALPAVRACADTQSLMNQMPPPDDAETLEEASEVRSRLAEAHALHLAGRFDSGLAIAEEAVEAADPLDYWPLTAEALAIRGLLEEGTEQRAAEAKQTFLDALLAAEAGRHDRAAAEAFVRLVRITGHQLAQVPEARRFGRQAQSILADLDDDRALEADLADHLGLMHLQAGELEEAVDQHRRALRIRAEDGQAADGAPVARTRLRLGNALKQLGSFDEARTELEEALALYESILGPSHPEVAANLDRLGGLALDAGDLDAARAYYQRALDILARVFGEGHVRLGNTLSNFGLVHLARGETDEAVELFERAATIFRDTHGEGHPKLAISLNNIGSALSDQDRHAEALHYFERVHRIHLDTYGEMHPNTGLSIYNLGEVHRELEQLETALDEHGQALRIWRQTLPPDHFYIGHGHLGHGRVLAGLGRHRSAVRDLEQALEIWSLPGRDPNWIAEAELDLALSLEVLGERERAVELCRSARAVFADASEKYRTELAEAEACSRDAVAP